MALNKTEMFGRILECMLRDFSLDRQGVLSGECQWACQYLLFDYLD